MLTARQKGLIYVDMIILGLDSRGGVGAQIFSRVRDGAYGLESRNLEEVSAFYMEMHDKAQVAIEEVREKIQDVKQDLINDLEEEDGNDDNERT